MINGCGQIKVDRTDSKSTAKAILIAYKAKDLKSLSNLSHSYNVEIFDEIIEQGQQHPRYSSLFNGGRWNVVNNWDGYSLEIIEENAKESSSVKFGESKDENYIVSLIWKHEEWCFEDIHSN